MISFRIHTIINHDPLVKIRLPRPRLTRPLQRRRIRNRRKPILRLLLRNRIRQTTRSVDVSPEDIDDAIPCFLAREVCGQDGGDVWVVRPGKHIHAVGVHDDDSVGAGGRDSGDDFVALPVWGEVVRSSFSVAQDLRKTRQTSGEEGRSAFMLLSVVSISWDLYGIYMCV